MRPRRTRHGCPESVLRAEQEVMGNVLVYGASALARIEHLQESDFWREAHRKILGAYRTVHTRGKRISLASVLDVLEQSAGVDRVGGLAYLNALSNLATSPEHLPTLVCILTEASAKRQLLDFSDGVRDMALNGLPPVEAIEHCRKALDAIGEHTRRGERPDDDEPAALPVPEIAASLGPDPEPLVDGLLVPGTAGLFNSNPGDGKTTATDSLALSVTTGDSVFGHFEVPHTANALLVQLEDGTRRHIRRLQRLARGMGIDGLPAGLFIWRFEGGFALDNEEHLARLEGFIQEMKIALVVIDPFVYTHSKDENDNRAMADLLFPIKQLATETGAVIILVHHYNKPTSDKAKTGGARIRGGTVIWGWRDFAFYFSRSGESRRVDIENKDLGNKKFMLRLVREEDGREHLEYQPFIEGVAERNRAKMLDTLRDLSKAAGTGDDGWVGLRTVGEAADLKSLNTVKKHAKALAEEGAVEYDAERMFQGSKRPCIRLVEEE